MKASFSTKIGMEHCMNCGHRWIDYENARATCYLCGSSNISDCISIRELRDAMMELRKADKKYLDKYAKRTIILKQRYREIAEIALQRAQEMFNKVKDHYTRGNLTETVLDQLIVAFRLFSELGMYKSAGVCAYMVAMGYAQRGVEKEVHTIDDLNDLVAARQWFMRLGSKEWESAVNFHIGEKALSVINTDHQILQTMMQISLWHFYRARDYYYSQNNKAMVERIQFDIERATQLLSSYTEGAAQIESAKITAQANIKYGEEVRKGLESFGKSVQFGLTALGENIEKAGGSLSRALQYSSAAMTSHLTHAVYAVASTPKLRGRSLDKRMSDVGQLIATTAREIPPGYLQQIKELGAKFVPGTSETEKTKDITQDPSVIKLAESVTPEIQKSEARLKEIEEPSFKLTGTILDAIIAKGLDKVNEERQKEMNKVENNV